MGQAKHKKHLAVLGRGPKTRGTGFHYVETIPAEARELTEADIAAAEEQSRKEAVLEEGRRLREWNITALTAAADKMLRLWKNTSDLNDKRLAEFSGWTTDNFYPLPVVDEDVANLYADEIDDHIHITGRPVPLTLAEMDKIIGYAFRSKRLVPTEEVVKRAAESVSSAAEKCCDHGGVDVEHLIHMLTGRSARAKPNRNDLDSALAFVATKMSSVFEVLCNGATRDDYSARLAEPEEFGFGVGMTPMRRGFKLPT